MFDNLRQAVTVQCEDTGNLNLRTFVGIFILLSLEISFSGCAVQYVDSFGAQHSWGFMHVVTKTSNSNLHTITNLQQISTFGIYYTSLENRSSVGIGYLRSYGININDNSAVDILLDPDNPQNYRVKSCSIIDGGDYVSK